MSESNHRDAGDLWSWPELTRALTGRSQAGPAVSGVTVDSRQVVRGDLFIALPGDPGPRFNPSYRSDIDGHDFVADAASRGAAGAVVHRVVAAEVALIEVDDTYDALWALGHAARQRLEGDVIGITGSSGKTTAKHFVAAALDAYAPPGSFNNHIGVPLSLANAPAGAAAAVFEIGTNHPGEIEPLARMVMPDVAVLLNVHRAHIENFSSWDALKEEKVSIFSGLNHKSKAIYEDTLGLSGGMSFGLGDGADVRVAGLTGDRATLEFQGRTFDARVPGGGAHRALTVAATLLVCHLCERDLEAALDLPVDLVPAGRGNIVDTPAARLIDDSYNANPDSMAAALTTLASWPGRRIAVLGEMLELGDAAAQAHADLAPLLTDTDAVFCVGEGMRALAAALPDAAWFAEADTALLDEICAAISGECTVLVKGSNRVFWSRQFFARLNQRLAGQPD